MRLYLLSFFNFSPASGTACKWAIPVVYVRDHVWRDTSAWVRVQTRVYLSRSHGLKRHTALNKTSGLASPRANYPHLFLDHVRKRAARTSSSRHRRAAAVAAARSRWRARAALSRCSSRPWFFQSHARSVPSIIIDATSIPMTCLLRLWLVASWICMTPLRTLTRVFSFAN